MGAAVLILAATFAFSVRRRGKQEALVGEIVRYSENYLRSCINEALYNEANIADLMDHSVGTVVLKKVVNTEDTTEITVRVHVSEIYLPEGKKPYTKKSKRYSPCKGHGIPKGERWTAAFLQKSPVRPAEQILSRTRSTAAHFADTV